MNSPKVKTQKNLSALIAVALAVVTLISAGTTNATEPSPKKVNLVEAEVIAEIEQMLIEDAEVLEYEAYDFEDDNSSVKVFDSNNELIAEGDTQEDKALRVLVHKAELMSEVGHTKYYSIVK